MDDREKYISDMDANLKKFKGKIGNVDQIVKKYNSPNKSKIKSEGEILQEKYKKAEDAYQKLKASTQENFGEIRAASSEILDSLSESFDEFSHLLTAKDFNRLKDKTADFGAEKMSEVEDYIKQNPFTCLVGAFSIGLLLEFFMNRTK